jgi:two-component system chemotaxis response regulator CheY
MKPVFLVDDSSTMLASISGVLKNSGLTVETARSAELALEKLRSGPQLRLIITDYHMPGMNGVEMIKLVRKMSAYRFLPILVLTTVSEDGKRQEARAAGATGWLVKPVETAKLLQVINQVAPV